MKELPSRVPAKPGGPILHTTPLGPDMGFWPLWKVVPESSMLPIHLPVRNR